MQLDAETIAPLHIRPLKRAEYDKLVELGVFDDERLELLCGVLVAMSPQGALHAALVAEVAELLRAALGKRAMIRSHSPFAASDDSEPEPDIAVVPRGNYRRQHPSVAHLLVEVADSSARKDREIKARVYAAAGVPEYWLLDVQRDVLEVYTTPRRGKYTRRLVKRRSDRVRLKAFPDVEIRVANVLP